MAIYQFLIATQFSYTKGLGMLTDEQGNPTAHIVGLFNRTIQFLEAGIRPVWVFDGKPPILKNNTLNKRKKLKEDAKEIVESAREELKQRRKSSSPKSTQRKKFVRFQAETHEAENRQRARLIELYGITVPKFQSKDFYCEGESEPEEGRSAQRFQEMDDLVSSLERRGVGIL